ncbi:MAG: hypothetical protein D6731_25125, partial [Planctomycetota bacterium]
MRRAGPWLLLVFLLGTGRPSRADDLPVRGRFDVEFDTDGERLEGRGWLRVRNVTAAPVSLLPLVLYGARFRERDPAINDRNFDFYYVRWFGAGDMRLRIVRLDGRPLRFGPHPDPDLPPGVAVEVTLP